MERIVRGRWGGASGVSTVLNALVAIAIFGFGAPLWTLILVNLAGLTLYLELASHVRRRSGGY
jgi:zinc transporter ZupT